MVPEELAADTVRDGCHKLAPETQLSTQRRGEVFRVVVRVTHVPLELVVERDVANVYVQL